MLPACRSECLPDAPRAASAWHFFGHQLKCPTGIAGRLTGHLMRAVNRRPNALAIGRLAIGPADQILEIGFGPGEAIRTMAAKAKAGRVYGVDRSAAMVSLASRRNRCGIADGRVRLFEANSLSLPLAAESIDKILAVNVIYFWDDVAGVLHEARRVLRHGGVLSLYATDAAAMRRWKFAGPETHHLYSEESLRRVLGEAADSRDDVSVERVMVAPGLPGLIAVLVKNDGGNDRSKRSIQA